jgi:hypothetical protein
MERRNNSKKCVPGSGGRRAYLCADASTASSILLVSRVKAKKGATEVKSRLTGLVLVVKPDSKPASMQNTQVANLNHKDEIQYKHSTVNHRECLQLPLNCFVRSANRAIAGGRWWGSLCYYVSGH